MTYKFMRHWEVNAAKRNLKERNRFDIDNAVDFFEINYLLKDVYLVDLRRGLANDFIRSILSCIIDTKTRSTIGKPLSRTVLCIRIIRSA